jgi:hypothetical protein
MQNRAFSLLLVCASFCLLSCGEGAQIDEQPPLPLELDLYSSPHFKDNYVYARIWMGNTLFNSNEAESLFLDYFWTIDDNRIHHKLEQKLSNGSDGRSEVLVRFTVVDHLGDTLSDTLRVELPLWVKLVSPVDRYVAGVGEQVRFIYQSNKPVQLELWKCESETEPCALLIPNLGAQAKLDSGTYYWGVQGTQYFRYLEVHQQVQP